MDKKIMLITGASGYLGGHLKKSFSKEFNVKTFSFSKNDIEKLDLSDVEIIIHCSAIVHQKKNISLDKYLEINAYKTIEFAKSAKKMGVKHFVFISSVSVYGNKPLIDEDTQCSPTTPYGISKLRAEEGLMSINDMCVSIIRLPMVYGKNAPGNMQTLIKIVKKFPFLPFGDISNKRSFLYVENFLLGMEKIIEKRKSGIFLLSDNDDVSTTILIENIAKSLDKKIYLFKAFWLQKLIQIFKNSIFQKIYANMEIDNKKTIKKLELDNFYSLKEGIRTTINSKNRLK